MWNENLKWTLKGTKRDYVSLTVQAIPELTELSVRQPDGVENAHLLSQENIKELSFAGSLIQRGKSVSFIVEESQEWMQAAFQCIIEAC